MVEKVITPPGNVVDFARYRPGHNATGEALAISLRSCRHCGAALLDGEREDECSSAGVAAAAAPRKFYAD